MLVTIFRLVLMSSKGADVKHRENALGEKYFLELKKTRDGTCSTDTERHRERVHIILGGGSRPRRHREIMPR